MDDNGPRPEPDQSRIAWAAIISVLAHAILLAMLLITGASTSFRRSVATSAVVAVLLQPAPDPERIVSGVGPRPVMPDPIGIPHQRRKTPLLHHIFHPASKPPEAAVTAPSSAPTVDAGATNSINNLSGSGSIAVARGDVGNGGGGNPNGSSNSDDEIVPAEQVEHPPEVLSATEPEYSLRARLRGIEGTVVLRVIIDRAGNVEKQIDVIEAVSRLDTAAIEAVRKWRFKPGLDHSGKPIRVLIEIPVSFRLR